MHVRSALFFDHEIGVRRTDPNANDVRLAPCYDIVPTACYLLEDSLALTLAGSCSERVPTCSNSASMPVALPKTRLAVSLAAMKQVMWEQEGAGGTPSWPVN